MRFLPLLDNFVKSPTMDSLEDKTPTVEQKIFANTSSSGSSSCEREDPDLSTEEDEEETEDKKRRAGMDLPPVSKVPSTSDLSASYHEIFDTQMPPESAKAAVQRDEEEAEALARRESSSSNPPPLPPQIPNCDHNTEATTQYLTSKLVQDSLRWQTDHHHRGSCVTPPQSSSPSESPSRRINSGGGARRKGTAPGDQQISAEEFR